MAQQRQHHVGHVPPQPQQQQLQACCHGLGQWEGERGEKGGGSSLRQWVREGEEKREKEGERTP